MRAARPSLTLALFALPASLAAQQTAPERASFYLLLHGDTIVEERSARTPTELSGELRDRLRGARVSYTAALAPSALVTRIDLRTYRAGGDTAGEKASFVIDRDSLVAQIGSAAPVHHPSALGALAIVNPSVAFMEQMVLRARVLGGDSVSLAVFVLGAPQPIAAIVRRVAPDSVRLEYGAASIRVAVSPEGRVLGGVMPAQGITIVRGPAGPPLSAPRADYSAPRDAPYTAEDVVVATPAGLRLTGTLTVPRARPRGRAPAVVTITGSGPEDRDEQSGAIPGYRPFRELADTLGGRGIAVLRLDDRGVNGSDLGPPTATSEDFANDIRAAVAYLRTRPEIDPARIALVGHSEGGVIAPMIAATDSTLRGIVLMAATASTGRQIIAEQNRYMIDSVKHLTGARRDSAMAYAVRAADSLASKTPWLRYFFDYDPARAARRVHTPVLILQGETDRQVPAAEAAKLAAAFRAGGNRDVTVRLFPSTNHLFLEDASGSFVDAQGRLRYTSLPSLHVRREVLGAIADWLTTHFE